MMTLEQIKARTELVITPEELFFRKVCRVINENDLPLTSEGASEAMRIMRELGNTLPDYVVVLAITLLAQVFISNHRRNSGLGNTWVKNPK